ncbi:MULTISPECIES: sensor domain-containing protein [unclassified Nonomuraea]|uniref:sensor domain-containing protein n=1 Tax=unclassified Nonomuraea TaxID=2593643 RepID=UPI00340D02CE
MTTLRHRIATDTRYVLLGFPTAVMSFVLVLIGVAAGAGSAVAFVGLPILAAAAAMARNFADVERVLLPDVLGRRVARPRYQQAPSDAGWFRRTMNPLTSGQAALDMLHAVVAFPLAIATFVVTIVWWAGAIAGLTFPLYGWIIAGLPDFHGGLPELLGLGSDTTTFVVFNTVLGVLFALTLVPVVRGAALIKANLAQALLTRPAYDERPATVRAHRLAAAEF